MANKGSRPKPFSVQDLVGHEREFRVDGGAFVKAKVQPMANNPKNAEIITGLTDDGREVTAHWRKTRGIEGGG